ncbi:IS3 family transposase [Aliivibrio sp. S3TY1]|uniref:IS3 family transposase n=1 Tax=unclassified Aliivibrio TaxID=2645654 RepID=UPI003FCDC580
MRCHECRYEFFLYIAKTKNVIDINRFKFNVSVKETFKEHKITLGSRRIVSELAKKGIIIGRYKARMTMRRLGLVPKYPKKFKVTIDSVHNYRIEPNRLDRKLLVNKINTC